MKQVLAVCAVLVVAMRLAVPAAAQPDGDVIYGPDDRIDLYQTKSRRLRSLARATTALFSAKAVRIHGRRAQLETQPYGASFNLCADEPFYEQVTGAFCSGFLVAPDVLMTAGHCVSSQASCDETKFVFDFAVEKAGRMPLEVPARSVYGCKKLLDRQQVSAGPDWALVRLDRRVWWRTPLKLNRGGTIADQTPLVVIGHPAGLPTKIAGGARVRDGSRDGYFTANLDTYGGNSGSAVFNARTGVVEGILVRGAQDYVYRDNCMVSNRCSDDGCSGEDVTKVSIPASKLPSARHGERLAALEPEIAGLLERLQAE